MAEARNYEEYRAQVLDELGVEYEIEDIRNFRRWRLKVFQGLIGLMSITAFNQMLSEKIDSMKEDGSLERMLNEELFDLLNSNVESVKNWSEPEEYIEAYREEAVKNLASYLLYEYGSNCVVDNPIPVTDQVCWKYNTNYGYMGLFGRYLRFKYDDTQETDAGTLPVAYADCSTFTSLINKCIPYLESPYYYAFTTQDVDRKVLFRKACESGDLETKPYTFDMLNNYQTGRMAFIQNKIGTGLIQISSMHNGDEAPTMSNLDQLETGDMVYRGVSGNTYYKGIDHVGTFVRSLTELAEAEGVPEGVTFKTPSGDVSEIGYVVEFSGSLSQSNNYTDCMRITRIEDWMVHKINTREWVNIYIAKPISCILTSNKAYSHLTGKVICYDYDYDVEMARESDGGYKPVKLNSKIAGGLIINPYDDIDDYTIDGTFQCSLKSTKDTLLHAPSGSAYDNFGLICIGFGRNGNYGTQLALGTSSSNYQYIAMRTKTTEWSPWVNICTLDDMSANIGVKEALSGITTVNNIPANGYKEITINFNTPFTHAPRVMLQREVLAKNTTPDPDVYVCVLNGSVTTEHFKVRIYNATSEDVSAFYFSWYAYFTNQN